jgi:hypothetical protein
MDFKQEILASLRSGGDHRALLEIVHRHHEQGFADGDTYQRLEEIWREFGFHDTDVDSAVRNELEFVMERVWYFGANAS